MANESCGSEPYAATLFSNAIFCAYIIVAPFYILLAIFGHGLLWFAFAKEKSQQTSYTYQVYCAGSKTIEAFFRDLYLISTHTIVPALSPYPLQATLAKFYPWVWFASRLSIPVANACITLSLSLSVCMAADRVLALMKPIAYQTMRHVRNRRLTLVACILVSVGASASDVGRMKISERSTYYYVEPDFSYTGRIEVKVLALLRVAVQASALIALVVLNAFICYLYRTRYLNFKIKMVNTVAQKRAKEDERSLLQLTIVECSLTILVMCVLMSSYAFTYLAPPFYSCWANLIYSVSDTIRMLIDMSYVYVVVGISGKVRDQVLSALGRQTNVVQPLIRS